MTVRGNGATRGAWKPSCQLAAWGTDVLQAAGEAAAAGFGSGEIGSKELLAYGQDGNRLLDGLAARGMCISAVFELGHFENWQRRREIYWHHSRTAKLLAQLGLSAVVLGPGFPLRGQESAVTRLRMVEMIREIAKRYNEEGVKAGLHPHLGSGLFTEPQIDFVMEQVPAEEADLVPDFGHLAEAGIDVLPFLQRYLTRIPNMHIRDAVCLPHKEAEQTPAESRWRRRVRFCAPGKGELRLPQVFEALRTSGYAGWMTLELDADPGLSYAGQAADALELIRSSALDV